MLLRFCTITLYDSVRNLSHNCKKILMDGIINLYERKILLLKKMNNIPT